MKKWNTGKIALCASFCGAAYASLLNIGQWGATSDQIAESIGFLLGGALGGAMLAAAVAGFRNLLVARR